MMTLNGADFAALAALGLALVFAVRFVCAVAVLTLSAARPGLWAVLEADVSDFAEALVLSARA